MIIVLFLIAFFLLFGCAWLVWKLTVSRSHSLHSSYSHVPRAERNFGGVLLLLCVVVVGSVLLPFGFPSALRTGGADVFRYRLTLYVNYNGKTYSGSSVIEAKHVCCAPGGSGSHNAPPSAYFLYKGVAPIVNLSEGGWVFASIGAGSQIKYLPWRAYLGKIQHADDPGKVLRLPPDPPRLDIRFDDPRSHALYKLYWVPPGPEGPKNAVLITPSGTSRSKFLTVISKEQLPEVSKRKIELLNFTIEKTKSPLVKRNNSVPHWKKYLRRRHPMSMKLGPKFTLNALQTGEQR